MNPTSTASVPRSANRTPCVFFQRGTCIKGDACEFEHVRHLPTVLLLVTDRITGRAPSSEQGGVAKRPPCVFHQRGNCKFGTACANSHDLSAEPAPSQIPTAISRPACVCSFFPRNACSKGAGCAFSHVIESTKTNNVKSHQIASDMPPRQRRHESTIDDDIHTTSRTIAGANGTFTDGAAVVKIALFHDYSTLSMTNIAAGEKPEAIAMMLKRWSYYGVVDIIALKLDIRTSSQVAEVKVADGGHISREILSTRIDSKIDGLDVTVTPVQLGRSDAGTNRLQLSGVTCRWYNPSKSASLNYELSRLSVEAFMFMTKQTRELRGRYPTFEHVLVRDLIRVGNLYSRTTRGDLDQYTIGHPPDEILIGPSSHSNSPEVLEQQVKASLDKCGQVLDWKINQQPGVAKVQAYAKFSSPHEAAQAIR
jgi:hypothetical protein